MIPSDRGSVILDWSDSYTYSRGMLVTPDGPAVAPSEAAHLDALERAALRIHQTGLSVRRTTEEGVVELGVPDARATLDIVDLAGRRLFSRVVGGESGGFLHFDLARSTHLPAGVYFVRLMQGERRATTRVVLLR